MNEFINALEMPLHNTLYRVVSFLPRLLIAGILFLIFCGLAIFMRRAARRSLEAAKHIPWAVRLLIARTIYFVTILIGILVALSAANVDVTTVVASLGVAGFALGFALKDIIENFISGILLLFARPFEIHDQVTVGDFQGTVVDIEIRTTSLRTYDNEIVLIPNSQVFTSTVVNMTRLGTRRYTVGFDTSLSADSDSISRMALECVSETPGIAQEPAPFVLIAGIDAGSDAVHWSLYFWGDPLKASEVLLTSQVLTRLKNEMYGNGVSTPTATSATILKRATGPVDSSPL